MDIAILPSDHIPARFEQRLLFYEDFVIAMRAGHPYAKGLSVAQYCAAQHLVVSLTGDPYGFVDHILEQQGRRRRVAITVPNFMLALPILADTDLIAALPRQFAAMHSQRFGVIAREAPVSLGGFRLNAVTPKVAMMDAGVAWLFGVLGRKESAAKKRHNLRASSTPRIRD